MDSSNFVQLKPVGYSINPELVESIMIVIPKKLTQAFLNEYRQKFPSYLKDHNLSHLKLVSKNENIEQGVNFLLALKEDEEYITSQLNEDLRNAILEKKSVNVPSFPPIDKVQLKIWDSYWSIANNIVLSYPSPIVHNEKLISNLMREAIDTAFENYSKGFKFDSCLLFDGKKVLLRCSSVQERGDKNSINHCVMQLAKQFGKLCSNKNELDQQDLKSPILSKREPETTIEQNFLNSFNSQQYFMKDLSLIIVQEPCIMCSMALIHSRIKVVYYSMENQHLTGGMNQKNQINNIDQLNHKFIVYDNIERQYFIDKYKTLLNQ